MNETHYLAPLFQPRSVVVVGPCGDPGSIARIAARNLVAAGFRGPFAVVAPDAAGVEGIDCVRSLADLSVSAELALLGAPVEDVPDLLAGCAAAGVRVAILPAGFTTPPSERSQAARVLREAARRHGIRLLGPNALGVIRPDIGLNASIAHTTPMKGSVGLLSQSGALATSVIDWARPHGVGFSTVVTVGASLDIDFGDALDYLVSDPRTESIFLYIERIRDARRFMTALRAAARMKPVLLLKAGRHPDVAQAIHARVGTPPGSDAAFDAAVRRCGVVRLYNIGQLFAAAGALFSDFRPRGNRLAIVTNGGGLGFMAADRAADLGIPLTEFSEITANRLSKLLGDRWNGGNPVDLGRIADADTYREALQAVLEGPHVDGVLVLLSPQATTRPSEVARAIVDLARAADKPLVTCWIGEEHVGEARHLFDEARIPTFRTPEPAVELFSHISAYFRNQKLLMQVPGPLPHLDKPNVAAASAAIDAALAEGRDALTETESKTCLAAFGIPVATSRVAADEDAAERIAAEIGLPVAMKVDSADLVSKSDAGGVRLGVASLEAVRNAYRGILEAVTGSRPDATVRGVAIEPMVVRGNGRELALSARTDAVFGPLLSLGAGRRRGGGARAHALPPLNDFLARDLMHSAAVAPLLAATETRPAADRDALEDVLLRVSAILCELPEIRALDIDPLLVDENGAIALDARITVAAAPPSAGRYEHMAIHPYPSHLVAEWALADGTRVTLRPIRPEDATLTTEFVRSLSAETRYQRFMNTMRELSPAMVIRLTQIDYDREMAFVATVIDNGRERQIGVCRYAANPDGKTCEFAVVVADAWQHRGIARKLMTRLIDTAAQRGYARMEGVFLASNERMLHFVEKLGFELHTDPDDPSIKLGTLALTA
ncbi:bifunctional acetate--CoA ligase family protein/GNAT family N-acetyltransferase [Pseudazoarcus pumilus]|uniref:GNAT family N-acetyltransferase n=1 Tax=Pseudazoarcus pumilus TaxID=2067960 RepID=A0A2I6S6Z4_9RHOO|nr:bifunctional acetyl coenzyme A synthetase (ADP forming), alpha domain/GNAT family N-acetyltransferase [Pseudazoarcus pumilus]AUN95040.1 GNAT family N-acetyltransferase [Pseudazoarcus pumilus]